MTVTTRAFAALACMMIAVAGFEAADAYAVAPVPAKHAAIPLSMTANGDRASDLVMKIARYFGLSVVMSGTLSQRISAQLTNLDADAALSAVLTPLGVPYQRTGNVVFIGTAGAHTPAPIPATLTSREIKLTHIQAQDVARTLASANAGVGVRTAGTTIFLSGPSDRVNAAAALIARADRPSIILAQFNDSAVPPPGRGGGSPVPSTPPRTPAPAPASAEQAAPVQAITGGGAQTIEIVNLRSAVPGVNGAQSSTPADLANVVAQTLAGVGQEVRITAVPNSSQLAITGTPYAIELAKQVLNRIDVPQKLVILDTQILELNETTAKDLGLSFAPNTVITTVYSETTPQPVNSTGAAPPLLGLQPLYRTPLTLQFQLGLAIAAGKGKILADPRITTISGRTATIRAGDNLTVLTQTGGAAGTVTTTQLQTFQTGVTLDITPIVNEDGFIVVNLHPVINNVASFSSNGIPQISTRDTQTTVGLKDGQTLAIGGLIQNTNTHSINKIPILGDLPYIGKLFQNDSVNTSQDELIITVTPHIVDAMSAGPIIPFPATAPPLLGTPAPAKVVTYHASPAMPQVLHTPAPGPITVLGGAAPIVPGAPASPAPEASPPVPAPAQSAFGSTNVFTYGAAPSNNFAAAGDAPRIFFVSFSPTVLHNGTAVDVSAITTTNVAKVTVGYQGNQTPLSPAGSGKWQANFAFSTSVLPPNQPTVQLTLNATKNDGTVTSIPISVNVAP